MKKMLIIAGLLIALVGVAGVWAASTRSEEGSAPQRGTEQLCQEDGYGQGLCQGQGKGGQGKGGQGKGQKNCGGQGDRERRQDRKQDGSCGNTCQM